LLISSFKLQIASTINANFSIFIYIIDSLTLQNEKNLVIAKNLISLISKKGNWGIIS